MKMTLMGTGTSHGLPVIGCDCHVCTSPYKKDKRLRCSAYVVQGEAADKEAAHILIDCGPEFRLQALATGIKYIDAVLLTHSHADHLHGLDDLRIFSYVKLGGVRGAAEGSAKDLKVTESAGGGLPVYANSTAIKDLRYRFAYVFDPPKLGGGMPKIRLTDCATLTPEQPLVLKGIQALPVPMLHGPLPTAGWLLSCRGKDGKKHSIAYLTDCSSIPESSLALIRQESGILDHVVIDGLRRRPHSTHCSYEEALCYAGQLNPRNVWLTHLNHDLCHSEIAAFVRGLVKKNPALEGIQQAGGIISPAYDTLVLTAGE